jgi:hypothetical protein
MPRANRNHAPVFSEGRTAAVRFERTMDRLLRVSKEELAKREAAYRDAKEARRSNPPARPKGR